MAAAPEPGPTAARLARGLKAHRAGRLDEAAEQYREILASEPEHFDALHLLGLVTGARGDVDGGVALLLRALAREPKSALAHFNLGVMLKEAGRAAAAVPCFEAALSLRPDDVETLNYLGNARANLGDFAAAQTVFERALRLKPDHPETLNYLGLSLKGQYQNASAIECYQRALKLKPDYVEALNNLGIALHATQAFDAAREVYQRALQIDPNCIDVGFNLGFTELMQGDFANGWQHYQWCLRKPVSGPARHRQLPEWDGRPLAGTLLVWCDQGIGTQIMFGTLLQTARKFCQRLVVLVDRRLQAMFQRAHPGVEFYPEDDWPADLRADAAAAGCSLARWFLQRASDFPSVVRRPIAADPARAADYRSRLSSADGRKIVGISWRTRNAGNGAIRSIPLTALAPLLTQSFVFVDLQYGDTRAERAALSREVGAELRHLDELDNERELDELAALITACDLVISIDNSTVHLGGALGVPVWILLPVESDWRWMQGREDSVWYERVRLFRQAPGESWQPVIQRAAAALGLRA